MELHAPPVSYDRIVMASCQPSAKPARRHKGTQTFEYTLDESDLVCELDYHKADGDGWNEPRIPAHAELCEARLDGVDILADLLACEVAEIEEAFMNQQEDY